MEAPAVPTIDATKIDISPETCAFDAPLSLGIAFNSSADLGGAHWKLRYMVDMAQARHIIELGASEPCDYKVGPNTFAIDVEAFDFGRLRDKASKLANAGLLLAVLFQGEQEIIQISMLTTIEKAADGALTRTIYDPLQ